MNGVQTRLKCKPNVKRCKRFVFAAHSPLLHPNTLKTKAIIHFQTDHILTRFVFPPLYAGNMGLLSFGTGWDYGKRNQWETDILLGFIPKYSSKKTKVTMTLKQNYMPWSINIGKGFSTEPLACGLYLNTVFGDQFWVNEPDRYPKGYYGFSSKVRIHIYMGQRLTYDIDPQRRFLAKSVTFFYEISTCDLYLVSAVQNSYLRPRDYLSLSFGLKFQWL